MQAQISLKKLIALVNIDSAVCYILVAIALSFAIRLVLCFFKTKALVKGESDTTDSNENNIRGRNFKTIYWQSFGSYSGDVRIDDHWLPFLLGVVELIVFPFFMAQGFWKVIIGWIGVKALSSWGGRNTRTAYNRFLFGSLLTLIASGIVSMMFIG